MNGFSRSLMEESRPFPRLGSPPDSNASSPTPSSLESFGERENERENSVHPGEKIFNFPGSSSTESGGPVTLTSLTPISPSNEDVHSAEQYRNPLLPNISRLSNGAPFFTYLHQPIFPITESEKFRKMYAKKQKRASKREKNVMTVMKAEEIDGHKTEDSIDSILESIGEQVDEEKKTKGRKPKEKVEKPKTQKKDKRKSLDDNLRGSDKEDDDEDDNEAGEKNEAGSAGVNFQENFYVLSSVNELKSVEDVVIGSSPQSNFTKVTSKKGRGRRGKEEVGKPPAPAPAPALAPAMTEAERTLPRSRDFDRERNKQERKDSKAGRVESKEASTGPCQTQQVTDQVKFPQLAGSDFPALPGVAGLETAPLPGAWARLLTKASDTTPDNTDNEEDPDSVACDEAPAVIIPEVPSEVVSSEDLYDSDKNNNNNNNNACDEKVEVLTCPEEFEKAVANKESPVVIFSEEEGQVWTSSEFTFGFDVNEELVACAWSNEEAAPGPFKVQEPRQEMFLPFPTMAPIDSVDGAILEFGVAPSMRPLIVGVPVGVPVPASSFPLYSNHIMQTFPPYGGLTYPQLAEQDLKTEEQDGAVVSPESGISSSSPLSWQPESSPQLVSPPQPALHSQVTESLSNWSGHLSEEETDQDSGLASSHEARQGKAQSRFNFVEIVNYVSSSWSSISEDKKVQVFSPGA